MHNFFWKLCWLRGGVGLSKSKRLSIIILNWVLPKLHKKFEKLGCPKNGIKSSHLEGGGGLICRGKLSEKKEGPLVSL